jgi:hypothetical protein
MEKRLATWGCMKGNANPLGSYIRHTIGSGISQVGNFMKTFLHLGFNEDLNGRRVFDAEGPGGTPLGEPPTSTPVTN